ncbi:Uncharacterised protein [Mycobacteroides abscessus subsp. massiliense]|nr:Uncharacterised protein [Mycobacteroides abscessus subsp. massiliense]
MGKGHLLQGLEQLLVGEGARLGGIGEGVAQVAKRQVGQLGDEHGLVITAGAGPIAIGVWPQPGERAQQSGFAATCSGHRSSCRRWAYVRRCCSV